MFLPVFIYYMVFRFAPILGAFILSFQRFDVVAGLFRSPWIGFENFNQFWNSIFFTRLIRNTLMINLYSLVFGFTAPLILALLINEVGNRKIRSLVQTVTYFPNFISTVVVVSIVMIFLSPVNGVVNNVIQGLGGAKINFISKPEYFWSIFTSMNIWQTTGFNAIIYLAALTSIPQELYEAAMVDGAGRWRQLWNITLPGISSTIIILLLSLSNNQYVTMGQITFYPIGFTIQAYKRVLSYPLVLISYYNTVFYTVVGTFISLLLTVMGALVETQTGKWYMVHLCGRPIPAVGRYPLGRETAIQKMVWTPDNWLRLEGGGKKPQLQVPAPKLPEYLDQSGDLEL